VAVALLGLVGTVPANPSAIATSAASSASDPASANVIGFPLSRTGDAAYNVTLGYHAIAIRRMR
jgi:hypothetical protein